MKASEIKKAMKILGKQSPTALSNLYKNLTKEAKNTEELILISGIYIQCQTDIARLNSDISFVHKIMDSLTNYFQTEEIEYTKYSKKLKSDLLFSIDSKIDQCSETDEIRNVVLNDLTSETNKTVELLHQYLYDLDRKITLDQRNSMVRLFYPFYKAQQKMFLKRFHHTKLFKIEMAFTILFTIFLILIDKIVFNATISDYLAKNFPTSIPFLKLLSSQIFAYLWQIIASILSVFIFSFIVEYWRLGPNYQLITPKLSNKNISNLSNEIANKIGLSNKDWATGGGIFTAVGLFLDPTFIIPTLSLAFSVITYLFGRNIEKIKNDVKIKYSNKIDEGFYELNSAVEKWFEISKNDAHKAMVKCFMKNCVRLNGSYMNLDINIHFSRAA